jgi:hypothetical protein
MKMSFGKFKGESIEDIPHDYLAWCLEHIRDLNPYLRRAMLEELGLSEPASAGDIRPVVAKLEGGLKSWYRRMSLKHHPDHGGSNQAQIIINDCYESLCELIGETGGAR